MFQRAEVWGAQQRHWGGGGAQSRAVSKARGAEKGECKHVRIPAK